MSDAMTTHLRIVPDRCELGMTGADCRDLVVAMGGLLCDYCRRHPPTCEEDGCESTDVQRDGDGRWCGDHR